MDVDDRSRRTVFETSSSSSFSLRCVMAYEIAKILLEHAGTFLERTEAVETALSLGMPLSEIEDYLDWLEATRPPAKNSADAEDAA